MDISVVSWFGAIGNHVIIIILVHASLYTFTCRPIRYTPRSRVTNSFWFVQEFPSFSTNWSFPVLAPHIPGNPLVSGKMIFLVVLPRSVNAGS